MCYLSLISQWHNNAAHLFQTATVFASPMGFKVTVEDAKCIQANAFIQEGIFQEFAIKEDQITFKINLTVLLVSMETSMEHNDYHILKFILP